MKVFSTTSSHISCENLHSEDPISCELLSTKNPHQIIDGKKTLQPDLDTACLQAIVDGEPDTQSSRVSDHHRSPRAVEQSSVLWGGTPPTQSVPQGLGAGLQASLCSTYLVLVVG